MGPSLKMLCNINFSELNIGLFVAMVLLLLMSAFFSSSETAFSTANAIRIKNMADENVHGARRVLYIVNNYEKTLSTILIGNNLVNIANTTIAAYVFSKLIVDPGLANLLNTIIMTILVLIFGEILPKTIAKNDPLKFALLFSGPMYFLMVILTPISLPFRALQKLCTKASESEDEESHTVTEDELESIVDTMEEEGVLDAENADMIQSVLDMKETTAYDIMTPRVDVTAVKYNESIPNIQETFMKTMFSRIPVYDDSIDHIIGVLHQKDLYKAIVSGDKVLVKKLITKPLFVNENITANDLLKQMRSKKIHMAIVLDEYGGTSGIVTLEDIFEEMVGEIYDEHDKVESTEDIKKLNQHTYMVDPDTDVEDLFELLKIEHMPETDYNSVGGFLFGLSKELPKQNDVIVYKTEDERLVDNKYITVPVEIHFTLSQVEDNRIKEIKVNVIYLENEKEIA
ncbi:MAG: HlyC/CorC family transporter [Clostridia bacterium]|nr:HlyC/CorC family transporter [Clostridia bacterium]